ncbi:MAG: thiol reductant ABC exporter subunit CydD [Actinomyces sp.]|uniref:thiol reductant ABC exporter subunit CydD n=1 Tax=Actinomyces sp. TaxID=29317 RepID=UPI002902DFF2|nr:thiol reductant ABC exporter subunit CydD [Actinomyces sp.]MDU2260063.1 thiol reductant ABC exporter subunit CydD [Actinomyces sp.]
MRPLDPRLLKYASSARRHIILISILGIVTAVLVIAQTLALSAALSPAVTSGASLTQVRTPLLLLVAIVIARAAVIGVREALGHRAADRTIRELRGRVLTHISNLGPRWRATHGSEASTLLSRGLTDLSPYFVDYLPQLVLTATVTPLALATILFLDFWSAFIAAIVVPLIPIFMALIGRFTQSASSEKLETMQTLGAQMLDLIAGLPTLRALGRESAPRAHLESLSRSNTRATMSTLRIAFLSGAVLEFLSTLCVALVAVEVGFRMVFGHVSLFTGLAVIMLAPEVFEPLRQVGAQFHASANGVAAAERAFEILETPIPSMDEDSENSVQGIQNIDWSSAAFSLRDLSIEARGTWAPAGLNADILPGTLSVLAGPSGSGKTSTIYALMRLLPIQSGQLMVRTCSGEEIPLQDIPKEALWKAITWVPQHPSLLPGTLREQLPSSTDEELEAAAALCGFTEVLDTLAERWDAPIGQDGAGLSVGQRQRFALTRALLARTPIVILDEPTAHLDAVSEEIVLKAIEALRKKGRTVIAIAHRQALIDAADQVIRVHSQVKHKAELAEVGGEQ